MITPTQLIYEAWKNTSQPMQLPNGKTRDWPEPEYIDVPDDVCWLCGGETEGRGRMHKDVIRPTFTNTPHAQATDSKSLCVACSWILAQRFIRNWSLYVVDGKFYHPGRAELRDIIARPPATYPWLLCIAVSGQKHISFPGHVVRSPRDTKILMEELLVPLPAEGIPDILEPVEMLYTGGFTKTEITTGQYRQNRIMNFGLSEWRMLEDEIAHLRGGRLLELAVFVAQKQEEGSSFTTDSTQKMKMPQQQHSSFTPSTGAGTGGDSVSRPTGGGSSNERSDRRPSVRQTSLFG